MRKWLKKGAHILHCRKFFVLILLSAVAIFLYGCGENTGRIRVWIDGGPNWIHYFEIKQEGESYYLNVYRTESEIPQEYPLRGTIYPTKDEEIIKYRCEKAIESATIELTQEQLNELKSLADLLEKREPDYMSPNDYFGECEVEYKGKTYKFYYRNQDKFITKLIEISPIPVVERGGWPLLPYEE